MIYELNIGLPQVLVVLVLLVQDIVQVAKQQADRYDGTPLLALPIGIFIDVVVCLVLYWGGFFTKIVCG